MPYKTDTKLPARNELLGVAGHEKNDARRRAACQSKDITYVQVDGEEMLKLDKPTLEEVTEGKVLFWLRGHAGLDSLHRR